MSDFSWKAKQWFRKALPFALILGVVYVGYNMHRRGTFRHGLKPAISSVLRKLPYFGSRFRHYSPSYSYGSKYSHGRSRHHGRRHYGRHGRRHHRRHR